MTNKKSCRQCQKLWTDARNYTNATTLEYSNIFKQIKGKKNVLAVYIHVSRLLQIASLYQNIVKRNDLIHFAMAYCYRRSARQILESKIGLNTHAYYDMS